MSETITLTPRYVATIDQDTIDAESPREWDNFGIMICFHRNYQLGDKHDMSIEDLQAIVARPDVVSLPLFLYDHSGISMSTQTEPTWFHAAWDSGKVGYIYVTREKILKDFNRKLLTKKLREDAARILRAEVEVYDQYLTGDVWHVVVRDREANMEVVESVGGIYGYQEAKKEAQSIIDGLTRQSLLPGFALEEA